MRLSIAPKIKRLASGFQLIGSVWGEFGNRSAGLGVREVVLLFSKNRFRQNRLSVLEGLGNRGDASAIDVKIAFVVHLHFAEYLPLLLRRMELFNLNQSWSLFVSTSNEAIFDTLQKAMLERGIRGRVVKIPNRGRNFSPLLVEFSQDILQNEFLVHLHSKRSTHMSARMAKDWSLDSWKLLFLQDQLMRMWISGFQLRDSLGLVYAEPRNLVRNINLTWGRDFSHLQKWTEGLNLVAPTSLFRYLDFPAGGMFAARVEALRPLLRTSFAYEDFPKETGQVDGTLQHAIERAIGAVVTSSGFEIGSYDFQTDGVYLERGFGAKERN